jgi:hypothetical protein
MSSRHAINPSRHAREVGMLEEPINVLLRLELEVEVTHAVVEEQQAVAA